MMKWFKKRKEIDQVALGINERNLKLVYPLNPRKYFHLADDKVLTKAILEEQKVSVAEQFMVIESVGDITEKWAATPRKSCVIKPSKGSGGGGILIVDYDEENGWTKGGKPISEDTIERHIANIIFGVFSFGADDKVLIEEKIIQHKTVTNLCHLGIADVRVIVKEGEIVMAMLRLPTKSSDGKANLHQGAVGVGVDIETGILKKVFDLQSYAEIHPDSGQQITGVQLPDWPKVLDTCLKVDAAFPLNYLGIDIAFDQHKGPMVLEINVRPGLEIQNVNQDGLRRTII